MAAKLSHKITKMAEKVVMRDQGLFIMYNMGMRMNLENDNPRATPIGIYNGMVSLTKSMLEQSNQFTMEELEKVDYDSFVKPYVDEIDRFEDSYKVQVNKQQIMGILRSHLPKEFED